MAKPCRFYKLSIRVGTKNPEQVAGTVLAQFCDRNGVAGEDIKILADNVTGETWHYHVLLWSVKTNRAEFARPKNLNMEEF